MTESSAVSVSFAAQLIVSTNILPLNYNLGHFTCFKYIIDPSVLKMYCKSANVSFCKPALTLWELRTIRTEEMYRNMLCCVFGTVTDGEDGRGPVGKYCIVLNMKW